MAYLLALRLPDGTCPSDLANTDATGGVSAAPGGIPEGVATPAATPAPRPRLPRRRAPPQKVVRARVPPRRSTSAPGIAWSTNEITVCRAGDPSVQRRLRRPPQLRIEGYNDDAPVDMPLGSQSMAVPARPAPGDYTFYCAIPGHRARYGRHDYDPPGGRLRRAAAESPPPAEGEAPPAAVRWSSFPPRHRLEHQRDHDRPGRHDPPGQRRLRRPPQLRHRGVQRRRPGRHARRPETDWVVPDDLAPGAYTYYCAIPATAPLWKAR